MPTTSSFPTLLNATHDGTADELQITLDFDIAMAAGSGIVYVTDGAVQTVIDRATGLPTMRIVGATDTHAVSVSDLAFDGDQVTFDVGGLLAGHTYSVVMGAGVLQSSGHAAYGGVRDTATVQFTAPDAAPGPTLVAHASDGDLLQAGGSITVTLTFSEAVANLNAAALSADHATVGSLATNDGGLTWIVTLTPPDGAIDTSGNTLAIDMSKVSDAAGHAGSGIDTAATYQVDTVVGAYVTQFDVADDRGPSAGDGVTSDPYVSFTGAFAGDVAYGQHVEIDAVGTDGAHHVYYAYPGMQDAGWNSYEGDTLADGSYTVTARLVDDEYEGETLVEHTSASTTRQITIDTVAPTLTNAAGANLDAATPLVLSFSEAVYWTDNGDNQLQIQDRSGGGSVYISLADANFSADHKTVTLNANQLQLVAGHDYTLYLNALTDLAGNSGDTSVNFHAAGTYVDTTPPSAIGATSFDGGVHGVGSTITIDIAFDEAVQAANGALPDLALNNGAVAVYDAADSSADTLVYRYVVQAGDESTAQLDIANASALAGHVADLAGNLLDAAHISYTHLSGADGYGHALDVAVNTIPAAPTPHLAAASDTGSASDDGITRDAAPTLAGTAGEPNGSMQIRDGDTLLGTAAVDADGNWQFTVDPDHPLSDGQHALSVAQVDAHGIVGAASDPLWITIDTAAPALDSIDATQPGHTSNQLNLVFADDVVFAQGSIDVVDDRGNVVKHYSADDASNWKIEERDDGAYHVLELDLGGASGHLTVHVNGDAVQDVAGNVALIGTPNLEVPPISA